MNADFNRFGFVVDDSENDEPLPDFWELWDSIFLRLNVVDRALFSQLDAFIIDYDSSRFIIKIGIRGEHTLAAKDVCVHKRSILESVASSVLGCSVHVMYKFV